MKKFLVTILLCCLLCGCGAEESAEDTYVEPDLTQRAEYYNVFGTEFPAFGPVCGFDEVDDVVKIHPYYNSDKHIEVKKILLSDRSFWKVVCESTTTPEVAEYKGFETMTTVDGVTYGYVPLSDKWALFVKSDSLPSSYVRMVCERLCKSD